MAVYVDLVAVLNFAVDFLLLLGTNRLCGYPPQWRRTVLAAVLGGIYGGACLLPGFRFLGNTLWRICCLVLMSGIAFGFCWMAVRRCAVFVLLSMALGGIAMGFGDGGSATVLFAAAGVAVMCAVGFRDRIGGAAYLPVELTYGGRQIRFLALQDTGNTLRDPVTGRAVLVVGADVATKLIGLSEQQLRHPIEVLSQSAISGLRLIPYHGLGQSGGMLLALRIPEVKIGKWKGSSLVAFAPERLSREGAYQALTGGMAL